MKPRLWRGAFFASLTMLIALSEVRAESTGWDSMNPSLTVRFDSEFALQPRNGYGQKFENNIFAELLLDPLPNLQLVARLRIRTEALDNLDPGGFSTESYARGTKPASPGDVTEIDHREIFLQWQQGPLRVRAGKQQLVWGEADGLKVLDLLNPQDLREFILPDFSESRIPLWALSVDLELGESGARFSNWLPEGSALQLLFIPDPTVHDIPDIEDLREGPDARYAPTSKRIVPPPVPTEFFGAIEFPAEQPRPEWKPSNFDAGARLTLPIGRVDTAFYYLWHIDDFPVIQYGPATLERDDVPPIPRFFLEVRTLLENRRYHMAGASASTAIGDWVVRGEISYAFDRDISQRYTLPLPDFIGDTDEQVGRSDDIAWVLGVDWFGLSDTLLSVQGFQNWIVDHDDEMLRRKIETAMTFFARRRFLDERLSVELMYLLDINDADGLVRPRVDYEWNDHLSLWVGADVFHGDSEGYFGQYDKKDRIVFGFSVGWTSD